MVFDLSYNLGYWVVPILSTIIGTLGILLGVYVSREKGDIQQAFTISLIVNVLITLGIIGMLISYLPIPFASLILTLLSWTVLVKMFYNPSTIQSTLIISVIAFGLTYIISLTGILYSIASFIPI